MTAIPDSGPFTKSIQSSGLTKCVNNTGFDRVKGGRSDSGHAG